MNVPPSSIFTEQDPFQYGTQLAAIGLLTLANTQFKLVLEKDPSHKEAKLALGMLCEELGLGDAAELWYRSLAEKPLSSGVGMRKLAGLLSARGRLSESELWWRTLVGGNDVTEQDRYELALTLLEQNKPQEGESILRSMLAVNPQSGWAHLGLGRVFCGEEAWGIAVGCFHQALEHGDSTPAYRSWALYQAAYAYLQLEKREVAVRLIQLVLIETPDYADAYFIQSMILAQDCHYPEALHWAGKAVRLDPDNFLYYYHSAQLYWELEDRPQAYLALQWAINLNPNYGPLYRCRGLWAYRDHDLPLAQESYEWAITLHAADSEVLAHLAHVALLQNDLVRTDYYSALGQLVSDLQWPALVAFAVSWLRCDQPAQARIAGLLLETTFPNQSQWRKQHPDLVAVIQLSQSTLGAGLGQGRS